MIFLPSAYIAFVCSGATVSMETVQMGFLTNIKLCIHSYVSFCAWCNLVHCECSLASGLMTVPAANITDMNVVTPALQ